MEPGIAFVLGLLTGAVAVLAVAAFRAEGYGAQMDTTRPPLAFYPGTKTGRDIWARPPKPKPEEAKP